MDKPLVYFTAVVALGAVAQWLAWRLRLPSILLLLALGFGLGHLGAIEQVVNDPTIERNVLLPLVALSVGVILFEGGLTLQLRELRESGRVVFRLVTVAVLVTWVLATAACHWLLGFELEIAALAGAIFTVSGPTVVAPLLRHIRPTGRISSIVKWEGIVNDPIGAVLAVVVFEAAFAGGMAEAWMHALGALLVGTLVGVVAAWLLMQALKRYLVPDYLHVPLFLAAVVLTYTASNWRFHEAGLVAVTVLGIALANQRTVAMRHVAEFKENLQVLLISALFIILSSRVSFADVQQLGWAGLAFLAVLILVIRPAAVFVSTLASDLNLKERVFLSCLAPRGIVAVAVASVFALRVANLPAEEAVSAAILRQMDQLVPLTFLVIFGTVGVYGLLARPLARRLELSEPSPQGVLFAGAEPWVQAIAKALSDDGYRVLLVDTNYDNLAAARMQGLPTCHANILSEFAQEELDLQGIGRLMAMTPNDEINSLATLVFGHHFGRAGVYQLAPEAGGAERKEAAPFMRGRLLFGSDVTHDLLLGRFFAGAAVKKTKLSDEFTFEDYQAEHGESAIVLFRVSEAGKLIVCTAEETSAPKAGESLISLVDAQLESSL